MEFCTMNTDGTAKKREVIKIQSLRPISDVNKLNNLCNYIITHSTENVNFKITSRKLYLIENI